MVTQRKIDKTVETSAIGLAKAHFPTFQIRSDESLSVQASKVAASTIRLMPVVSVGDAARSNKVMAKSETLPTGNEEAHSHQLLQVPRRYKRVVGKLAEMGQASGKALLHGARADRRKALVLQDANSRRSRPLKERLQLQSWTINGVLRCALMHLQNLLHHLVKRATHLRQLRSQLLPPDPDSTLQNVQSPRPSLVCLQLLRLQIPRPVLLVLHVLLTLCKETRRSRRRDNLPFDRRKKQMTKLERKRLKRSD